MNEFRLIGEVLSIVSWDFPSGKSKITWTLKAMISDKRFTFLQCETWNDALKQGLANGMVVELIHYIPQTQSWVSKTGVTNYKHVIVVNNLLIHQQHTSSPQEDKLKQASNVPKQEFNPYIFDEKPQDEPDWMKELDEMEKQTKVDDVLNKSVTTTPYQAPQQENKVEPLSAEQVYKNLMEKQAQEKEPQVPYTYEQLLEMNKPYQHPTIVKPTILATPDGGVTTTDKIKVNDFDN